MFTAWESGTRLPDHSFMMKNHDEELSECMSLFVSNNLGL